MIKIDLDETLPANAEIQYVLNLWAVNHGTSIAFVRDEQSFRIDATNRSVIQMNSLFVNKEFFAMEPSEVFIRNEKEDTDPIATAFFYLTCVQELKISARDELGRFRYSDSYQYKNGSLHENIVQECFDIISRMFNLTPRQEKSSFFLTHDIDLVHGAILEDGFNVLKKGRIDQFLRLMFNVAMGRPDWLNIDKIMQIESEYDCRSVFYWLVNKGVINKRERNSDYDFRSAEIQKHFSLVEKNGFENGLHKSISTETFTEEFRKYGSTPVGNRYHYLKFSLPNAFNDIEKSGLMLDASLGFAENIGFRNNYGLPFNPYDFNKRRPYRFVEVPLHVMDRTFFQYKRSVLKEAETELIDFFDKNKQNCVISVLWHNNFFSNYKFKGYLDLYKKILVYIKENGFKTVSQKEIINQFSISK